MSRSPGLAYFAINLITPTCMKTPLNIQEDNMRFKCKKPVFHLYSAYVSNNN